MQFQSWLRGSEIGLCHPLAFQNYYQFERALRLQVGTKKLGCVPSGAVTSMQLDSIDQQYLISSGPQRAIFIHNTWCRTASKEISLVASVDKTSKLQHSKAIHRILWYPHDTGMFVTSSFDGCIKIWDTNQMKPVETMRIKHPICDHHISPYPHSLIAATASSQIRLADIRTGSISHSLRGHEANVLCVKWSPKSEYVLSSGSKDNKIYSWDIRHAKALLKTFDQQNGLEGNGESRTCSTAHNGHVNSLLYNTDGRYILSFGTDERLRLWNADTGVNTLVNYGRLENNSQHLPLYMSLMDGGTVSSVVYVPSGHHICSLNLYTGTVLQTLSNHFSIVRCCEFNSNTHELYTCSQSSRVLIWSPDAMNFDHVQEEPTSDVMSTLLSDTWSDSD